MKYRLLTYDDIADAGGPAHKDWYNVIERFAARNPDNRHNHEHNHEHGHIYVSRFVFCLAENGDSMYLSLHFHKTGGANFMNSISEPKSYISN